MRLKIIAGNLVAVLLLGLLAYGIVHSQLQSRLGADIDGRIGSDRVLVDRSWRYYDAELVLQVADRSSQREVREGLLALDDESKRNRCFENAERIAQWFADPSRRGSIPPLVVLTDETGRVIARNADRNRMYGTLLTTSLPALRHVLTDGAPGAADVWKQDDGKILQMAVAPVRNEQGGLVGSLVVGFEIADDFAHRVAEPLGRDVAFIADGKVCGSTLSNGPNRQRDLAAYLFGEGRAATAAAVAGTGEGSPSQVTLDGEVYLAALGHLANSDGINAGFVVLGNRSAAIAPASSTNVILILTIVFALVVLGYGFGIGTIMLRPIEQIEEGVLAVINGRTDTRLDIQSGELGGLAYRINQLLNVFTGVQETSEDESGRVSSPPDSAAWGDQAFADQPAAGGGAAASAGATDPIDDPAVAGPLAAEPEDAYYARVYKEYVAAKQAAGENVSNIPQDRFSQRLKGNEDALVKKHGCRAVRFKVERRDNQVVLRPVLIR